MRFKDASLTRRPNSGLYFADDQTKPDPPENERGTVGDVGVVIDMSGLKSGTYHGTYYTYYKSGFRRGDERPFL